MAVMFVEVKLNIGPPSEWKNAIAQVIAECIGQSVIHSLVTYTIDFATACDFNNRQDDISMPIYGMLCDGIIFQFFSFDGNTRPYKFSIGLDPSTQFKVIPLHDFSFQPTSHAFICGLRSICEIVFNLLLLTYIASLKAFMPCEGVAPQSGQENISAWDEGLSLGLRFAEEALKKSQNAEALCQDNLITNAHMVAEDALQDLKHRYDFLSKIIFLTKPINSINAVPTSRLDNIQSLMGGWDEREVSEV